MIRKKIIIEEPWKTQLADSKRKKGMKCRFPMRAFKHRSHMLCQLLNPLVHWTKSCQLHIYQRKPISQNVSSIYNYALTLAHEDMPTHIPTPQTTVSVTLRLENSFPLLTPFLHTLWTICILVIVYDHQRRVSGWLRKNDSTDGTHYERILQAISDK